MRALFGLSTLTIVFMVLMLGTAIEEYQEQPQKYSWIDANGEFKINSYDFNVTYNLDTPLDVFNGNSLNEVFYDNNFFRLNSPTNIYGIQDTNTSYLHHQYIVNTPHGASRVEWNILNSNLNDNYFIRFELQSEFDLDNNVLNASIFAYKDFQDYQSNDREIYYDLVSVVFPSTNKIRKYNSTSFLSQYDVINYYNMYLINLTDLGINQTKEEMEFWYSEYQRLQENRIEDMKFLGGEVTSQWTTFNNEYLQPTLDVIALYVKWLTNPAGVFIDLLEDITIIDTIG